MCTVLLPTGVNPIAVEKYIISHIIRETTELTVSTGSEVLYANSDVETNFTPKFMSCHAASQLVVCFCCW